MRGSYVARSDHCHSLAELRREVRVRLLHAAAHRPAERLFHHERHVRVDSPHRSSDERVWVGESSVAHDAVHITLELAKPANERCRDSPVLHGAVWSCHHSLALQRKSQFLKAGRIERKSMRRASVATKARENLLLGHERFELPVRLFRLNEAVVLRYLCFCQFR